MGTVRATAALTAFFALTVPLMPVQAMLVRVAPKSARRFPHWYHRQVCRILGITLLIEGAVDRDLPVLLVCNHTSWLDIPVLSALAPVSFVAKKEIGGWPFVSSLARLQQTVFVDRTRRLAAGDSADEISERLARGDTIVLFAEGTSSDGNRVLPFKTSLFGAVMGRGAATPVSLNAAVAVQTAAVVYTHRRGLPVSRAERSSLAWYGDMDMQSHAWNVLKAGPLTVTIRVGAPVPLSSFADRKELAIKTEREVRLVVHGILRGRPEDRTLEPVDPDPEKRRALRSQPKATSEKWT